MRPNSRAQKLIWLRRLILLAVIVLLDALAVAHPIEYIRGHYTVGPNAIRITVEPSEHELEHLGLHHDSQAMRRLAHWFQQGLEVLDRGGARVECAAEPRALTRRVEIVAQAKLLTWPLSLRFSPPADVLPYRGQVILIPNDGVQAGLGTIVLTTGGNVVRLDSAESAPRADHEPAASGTSGAESEGGMAWPQFDVRLDGGKATIRFKLPARMLTPISDLSAGYELNRLRDDERRALERELAERFSEDAMLVLTGNEQLQVNWQFFIGIEGAGSDGPGQTLNRWLASARVTTVVDVREGEQLLIRLGGVFGKVLGDARLSQSTGSVVARVRSDAETREGVLTAADSMIVINPDTFPDGVTIGRRCWPAPSPAATSQ